MFKPPKAVAEISTKFQLNTDSNKIKDQITFIQSLLPGCTVIEHPTHYSESKGSNATPIIEIEKMEISEKKIVKTLKLLSIIIMILKNVQKSVEHH
jgi:hypothetical protein